MIGQELFSILIFYPKSLQSQVRQLQERVKRQYTFFISQSEYPVFDEHGKIILADDCHLKVDEDGFGGILRSLFTLNLIEVLLAN
jgi:hypothetical protein